MKTYQFVPLLLASLAAIAHAQGPLTPPPGPDPNIGPANALTPGGLPQATMKTLHQVEPRMAIPGGTSGVVISQSGAYYLAGNIIIAGGDGITINASNVTLDLNGFSITTSATPASGIGVRLGQGLRNVAIRNGNIGGDGVGGAFASGVYYVVSGFPQPPQNLRVADLSVAATEFGISTGNSVATCHVERCLVAGGSVHGIQGGIVKDCVVEGGPIFGRIVKDSTVTTPGTSGIVAEVAENCYSTSAGTAIQAKCLVNSYGTGGGASDVISAGVAHNVWGEGGSGTGDGIEAMILSNGYGNRQNDLNGSSSGTGIVSTVVTGSMGHAAGGVGISSQIAQATSAHSATGNGLNSEVVSTSLGKTTTGDCGVLAENGVVHGSSGIGLKWGVQTNEITAVFGVFNENPEVSGVVTGSKGNSLITNQVNSGAIVESGICSDVISSSNGRSAAEVGLAGLVITGSVGRTSLGGAPVYSHNSSASNGYVSTSIANDGFSDAFHGYVISNCFTNADFIGESPSVLNSREKPGQPFP